LSTLTYPVIGITAALLIGDPAVASAQEPEKLREVRTVLLHGLTTSVAFRPDGKQILTSDFFAYDSATGEVRAWDIETGKQLLKLDKCESHVSQFVLSRDGKRLVAGSLDKSVKLWDAETGKLLRSFVGHEAEVVSVAISPDGKHIVSSSGHRLGLTVHKRREVHVWNAETGKLLRSLEIEKTVNRVAISPDGKRIAGSSGGNFADGTIILWDLETGKKLHTLTGPEGKASVWGGWYSRDGKRIIGATETDYSKDAADASLIEWDAETGKHLRTLQGPKGWLPPFEISPDGKQIASGARDGGLMLWDAQTARVIAVGKHPKSAGVRRIAFSPDGTRLVEGNGSYHATVWALGK
jgi:WD40 repeat protein